MIVCGYATAIDTPERKQRIAQDLLERLFLNPQACLAGQVLSEYLSVVLRKKTMPPALALETVNVWSQAARVLGVSTETYQQAWKLAATHQYQVWDALIIAICAEHGDLSCINKASTRAERCQGCRPMPAPPDGQ